MQKSTIIATCLLNAATVVDMETGEALVMTTFQQHFPDESFESALKRCTQQCEPAGLLSEFNQRQHYEKPSVRRKRKALAARKKAKRRERLND